MGARGGRIGGAPFPLATAGQLLLLLVCHAAVDRSESFIGYTEELGGTCEDRLDDCVKLARENGCSYNAFQMRQFCPTTCGVTRCVHGAKRVLYQGHATTEGTLAFKELMSRQFPLPVQAFSLVQLKPQDQALLLSRMGMGTYLGEADGATDELVISALLYTISHGWNVIDTASNYRWGRAEASVGLALSALLAGNTASAFGRSNGGSMTYDGSQGLDSPTIQDRVSSMLQQQARMERPADAAVIQDMLRAGASSIRTGGDITRDMLFVSTKVGFTTPELAKRLIKARKMTHKDVVEGMHSIHPAYIAASVQESLERLHLETVDLLYLHNAAEVQIPVVGRQEFMQRLEEAFGACEELIAAGQIRAYGLATWDCFRRPPGDPLYLSLSEVVALAQDVGGPNHGFRYVQLPLSAGMPEAWTEPWQEALMSNLSLVDAAKRLSVGVMTSGPLGEGGLLKGVVADRLEQAEDLFEWKTPATKLLQYARSVPDVTTVLVGHKSRANVEENVQLSFAEPLSKDIMVITQQGIAAAAARAAQATGNRRLKISR